MGKGKGVKRKRAQQERVFEAQPHFPFPFTHYPFPFAFPFLFRRTAKVITKQHAKRNGHSIAHCRKEMQPANGINCCLVQPKSGPTSHFHARYFTVSIQIHEHIDRCFYFGLGCAFRILRQKSPKGRGNRSPSVAAIFSSSGAASMTGVSRSNVKRAFATFCFCSADAPLVRTGGAFRFQTIRRAAIVRRLTAYLLCELAAPTRGVCPCARSRGKLKRTIRNKLRRSKANAEESARLPGNKNRSQGRRPDRALRLATNSCEPA